MMKKPEAASNVILITIVFHQPNHESLVKITDRLEGSTEILICNG